MKQNKLNASLGVMWQLEPRFMFDGAAAATAVDVADSTLTEAPTAVIDDATDNSKNTTSKFNNEANQLTQLANYEVPRGAVNEIIFIDTNVEDYETILSGIDPNIQVVLLNSQQDGIEQIARYLTDSQSIDALHIISHGDQGELRLGTSELNIESMQGEYADELSIINQALTAQADFLIYGCNFGEGEIGQEAAELLSELTGADVAASNNLTGSAALGGDWELEYQTGPIEIAVAISSFAQQEFASILTAVTVDTTNDAENGDTSSIANLISNDGGDGISLREAIIAANNTTGTDTIGFNIAGAGPHTIQVGNVTDGSNGALPTITDSLIIDGYTQPGSSVNTLPVGSDAVLKIGLDGTSAGVVDGLLITAGNSTVRGLAIHSFTNNGIALETNDGNIIEGNFIGTNVTGTALGLGNDDGVDIDSGSSSNTIGGTTAAARNIISGNKSDGIDIAGSGSNIVQGNYIGTDVGGTADLGNDSSGVIIKGSSSNNIIGGAAAGAGNVISGNTDDGVTIIGSSVTGNSVLGNLIGFNATGTATLGNGAQGVWIGSGSQSNLIGSTTAGAANFIGGSGGAAVQILGAGTNLNSVQGNIIGTNAAGTLNAGNARGVEMEGGAANNSIGGTTASAGNLITNSSGYGILVGDAGAGNALLGNSVLANGGIGIDLGDDWVTANDAGDGDTGSNNLQNFPVVTSANSNSSGTTIVGTLNSNADTNYRIEFFANRPSIADSPNGEGERYLGFFNVMTDGSGNAAINTTLANVWINAGDKVTSTATVDMGGGIYGDTSEFSANITATSTGVIVVDTTSDVSDGTTTSITNLGAARGADERISLREAIVAANNTANGGTTDRIVFNIPTNDANHLYYRDNATGGTFSAPVATTWSDSEITDFDADYMAGTARSWYRITLSGSDLNVTQGVIIDGSTQSGFDAAKGPIIEINAAGVSSGDPNGLTLSTGASTVRSLVINLAGDDAIEIDANADNSTIVGNYLGTDVSGLQTTFGNRYGITVKSDGNTIGGTTTADRNIISGNSTGGDSFGIGFWQSADSNVVQGNYIGVGADGTTAMGNRQGVTFQNTANANQIGGETAGAGNVIAFNSQNGVDVIAGTTNAIVRNSIHSNGLLGINLGTAGVTANDSGDGDSGANNLQNFPVLTSAVTNGTQITITGTLNSITSTSFRIEFYSNATGDGTGNGEGQTLIGIYDVTTNGSGNASFSPVLSATVSAGSTISAIASRLNPGDSPIETSEFALNVAATAAPNDVPVITNLGGDALAYTEGDGAVVIDQGSSALVTDVDSADFDTGTLTVSFTAGSDNAEDILAILNEGTGAEQIGVSGANVTYAGTTIGTFTGGNGGTNLVITLNNSANAAAVSALVQHVTFENTDTDTPTPGARTVRYVLTDGDGGTSANTDATVTVTATNYSPTDIVFDSESTGEQLVNTFTTDKQYAPAMAALPDGGYIATWTSLGQDGSFDGVYGQRYDVNGATVGSEFLVNSETSDYERFPSVATFADGSFVIVWQDRQTGVRAWVEARIFNADGTAAGTEFQVSPGMNGTNEAYRPVIETLDDDSFVIVWGNETAATDYEVVGQIYNRSGAVEVSMFVIGDLLSQTGMHLNNTRITQLEDGGFAVIWRTYDGATADSRMRIMEADGMPRTAEILLDGVALITGNAGAGDISGLADGGLVVVYEDGTDINARIFNANGTERVTEFTINQDTAGTQATPTVTRSDDGFVVAWLSDTGDGSGDGIFARRFDATGTALDPQIQVNTTTTGEQQHPYLIETTTGQVRIAWQSENISGDGSSFAVVSRMLATGDATVNGKAANGTRVADVIGVADLSPSNTYTFSLIDDAGGRFAIDSASGKVTVANTTLIDYETATSHNITVQVTDSEGNTYNEVLTIGINDIPPVITNLGGDVLAYTEGDGAVVIDQAASALVTDIDSSNFNTGTLTVAFTAGNDNAEDVLAIRNQGTGAGQIGVSGANITYAGTTIGTFTGGTAGANLVITLNSNADTTAVSALVQNITYENTNIHAPTIGSRHVDYVLTDGDGGTSANYDTIVNLTRATAGLEGHWRFDVDTTDSSGNHYNGTLSNGAAVDTADATDIVGEGKLSVDGSNDYVDLSTHVGNVSGLTEGTISGWIRTNGTKQTIFSVSDTADTNSYAALFLGTSGYVTFEVVENGTKLLATYNPKKIS